MAFNKVILVGNITADPELKQTSGGLSVTTFSLAVNRRFKSEGQQECDFINVVAWRQQAEFVCRYFKKGMPLLVCGQLQTRSWTDNQGNKRYATEVVADEVTFVAPASQASEPSVTPQSKGNGLGIVGAVFPEAYGGAPGNFEEIPVTGSCRSDKSKNYFERINENGKDNNLRIDR